MTPLATRSALAIAMLSPWTLLANATPIEVSSSFSGGIYDGGLTTPGFFNYYVGYSFPSSPPERRNFFIFDLSDIDTPVTGARIKLFLPGGPTLPSGYISSDPVEFYRVSGSAFPWTAYVEAFGGTATGPMLSAMFSTMGGSASAYGVVGISIDDSGTDIIIELGGSAIADINAALGSAFLVTGRLTDIHPGAPGMPPSELVFAYTDIPHPLMPLPRLELDIIPAPHSILPLLPLILAPRRRTR
ncbi:MAG: hypothetical protein KF902_09315 [Phycisphaeraceae bacterium]|nr:hypothetical protein [Phycisphaeraceae bacterium]